MEEVLCLLLGDLLESEDTGRTIYFTNGAFRQRIELIREVAKERICSDEDLESVLELMSKIYKAFQVRNKLIHAHYVIVVKDQEGDLSYVNYYLDDETTFEREKLIPQYVGRLDPSQESGVSKVNPGTFSNHGDRVIDLMHATLEVRDKFEDGSIKLFNGTERE